MGGSSQSGSGTENPLLPLGAPQPPPSSTLKTNRFVTPFFFFFSPERFIFLRAIYSTTSLERLGECDLEKITWRNSTLQRNKTAKPWLGTRWRNASGDRSVLVFPARDAARALLLPTVLVLVFLSPGRAVASAGSLVALVLPEGCWWHSSSPRAPVLNHPAQSRISAARPELVIRESGRCRRPCSSHRCGSSLVLGGPVCRQGTPGASGASALCCTRLSIALLLLLLLPFPSSPLVFAPVLLPPRARYPLAPPAVCTASPRTQRPAQPLAQRLAGI